MAFRSPPIEACNCIVFVEAAERASQRLDVHRRIAVVLRRSILPVDKDGLVQLEGNWLELELSVDGTVALDESAEDNRAIARAFAEELSHIGREMRN